MAKKRKTAKAAKSANGTKSKPAAPSADKPRCGLCGKKRNLVRTECCGNWICDDEENYVLFSYARNSCSRNHRRFTICGGHHEEGHAGRWQDCERCRANCETEMYVYFATNEYNFEKLENPPSFEPTLCSRCNRRIVLPDGGYSIQGRGKYTCGRCLNYDD
jgi:hypothetical protein